jgi:hypothetical protein
VDTGITPRVSNQSKEYWRRAFARDLNLSPHLNITDEEDNTIGLRFLCEFELERKAREEVEARVARVAQEEAEAAAAAMDVDNDDDDNDAMEGIEQGRLGGNWRKRKWKSEKGKGKGRGRGVMVHHHTHIHHHKHNYHGCVENGGHEE